jgi:CelD/BcsL family acetyltransferase involved in cellulose biosynthesis
VLVDAGLSAKETVRRLALVGEDAARLDDDLGLVFALHSARWDGETSFTRREAFHRAFARAAHERGWLRLWILEVDGTARAAWWGYRFAGVESYYQLGRDPAWERESVGFVLLVHSIREALADGAKEYRFGRGGEEYKYRFASDDPGLETAGLARTRLGEAALLSARAVPLVRGIRRRLRISRGAAALNRT